MTPSIWLFRATVLLALALLAERQVSPLRLRRWLLLSGAAGALALPLLAFELPALAPAIPQVSPEQVVEWVGLGGPSAVASPAPVGAPAGTSGAGWGLSRWGLLIWGLGSALLLARALAGRAWLARAVWRAQAAPSAWGAAVSGVPLRISAALSGAGLVGPWPRAVLLPTAALEWSDAERAQVLRHEGAHAAARDDWGQLLMQALTITLWPTPLAWWVRRRARLVAELAADEAVVTQGTAAVAYAETLARLARVGRPGLVAASAPGVLEARVRALLAGRRPAASGGQLSLAVGCGVLLTAALAGVSGTATSGTLASAPLQDTVDAELARLETLWHPEDAAIVVVDVRSGEVLASGDLHGTLLDTPLELGSVLKPFTVAAALEAGVSPDVTLPGHSGRWSVGGETIQDHRAAESLSLTELLAWSSNIGAAVLVEEIGVQPVREALLAAGVPAVPQVAEHSLEAARLGMGLGVPVSPVQLARAYAALGDVRGGAPFRAETVAAVQAGLAAALGSDGTAHAAARPGALGGKTGTAAHGEGYVASFAGLWAAPQGTAAVAVVVVEPQTARPYGGAVAAPSFARLIQ